MPTALDYSGGFPGGAAVAAAQHVGVIRYAGTPGRTKNITRAEFQDMAAHGIGVALVFEDAAGDALKGRPRGVTAAQAIVADAAAIEFPSSRPLYFAVDQDITNQMGVVLDYFRGIGSVLGDRPVGVYGEADVLDAVIGAGLATYGWQTVAWSRGRAAKVRHLYQRAGQTFVGGVQVDINDILAADWGQHNAQEDDVFTEQDFGKFMWDYRFDVPAGGGTGRNFAQYIKDMSAHVDGLNASLAALTKLITDSAQHPVDAQQLADALRGTITAEVGPVVREEVAAALGADNAQQADEIADAVLAKVAAKLAPAPAVG